MNGDYLKLVHIGIKETNLHITVWWGQHLKTLKEECTWHNHVDLFPNAWRDARN